MEKQVLLVKEEWRQRVDNQDQTHFCADKRKHGGRRESLCVCVSSSYAPRTTGRLSNIGLSQNINHHPLSPLLSVPSSSPPPLSSSHANSFPLFVIHLSSILSVLSSPPLLFHPFHLCSLTNFFSSHFFSLALNLIFQLNSHYQCSSVP